MPRYASGCKPLQGCEHSSCWLPLHDPHSSTAGGEVKPGPYAHIRTPAMRPVSKRGSCHWMRRAEGCAACFWSHSGYSSTTFVHPTFRRIKILGAMQGGSATGAQAALVTPEVAWATAWNEAHSLVQKIQATAAQSRAHAASLAPPGSVLRSGRSSKV